MKPFVLDGKDVGGRLVKAIHEQSVEGPIELSCRGARFRERTAFDGITFGKFDAAGATFDRGLALTKCDIVAPASLNGAAAPHLTIVDTRFRKAVYARNLEIGAIKLDGVDFDAYAAFDNAKFKQLTFRLTNFGAEARFRDVKVAQEGALHRVHFGSVGSFQRSGWRDLRFVACRMDGPVLFTQGETESLEMVGCRLADSRNVELHSEIRCALRETTFSQPLSLRIEAPQVDLSAASFERGVDLILAEGSELDLSRAAMDGPSLITTGGSGARARLLSIDGTRVDRLTLRRLDLSHCSFARAHALHDVVISGDDQLSTAPRLGPWSARREVVADEKDYRHSRELVRRPHGPTRWYRRGAPESVERPETLAETYRALRRGREEAKDRPGAASFYYGEMEMRRAAAKGLADRVVLQAYWLFSGYGLRASRALGAYLATVLLLTAGLCAWGIDESEIADKSDIPGTADVVAYVLATTTVLARPATELTLTTAGSYLQVAARILGPALLALMLLALRSRVRR